MRGFMLDTLGDLGFTPVRDLGPFGQVKFKDWDAWQVKARGLYLRYDEQWMVFYVPEVDKTYAIGTTVVLPPAGMDAPGAPEKVNFPRQAGQASSCRVVPFISYPLTRFPGSIF